MPQNRAQLRAFVSLSVQSPQFRHVDDVAMDDGHTDVARHGGNMLSYFHLNQPISVLSLHTLKNVFFILTLQI